jgi:transposase
MEDQTAFVETFGSSPLIKVLDFLMTYREFDYSLTDIAKESGVGWNTLNSFFSKLIEKGIVKETRQVGRARLYKLNTDNPIVQKLVEINNLVTSKAVDEELKRQEIEAD